MLLVVGDRQVRVKKTGQYPWVAWGRPVLIQPNTICTHDTLARNVAIKETTFASDGQIRAKIKEKHGDELLA